MKSVFLVLESSSSLELEYIKLEQGILASPYLPCNYDEEIRRCERFYNNKSTIAFGVVGGTNNSAFFGYMPMNVIMRESVTATLKNTTCTIHCNGVDYTSTITEIIAAVPRYGGMWIAFSFTGANVPGKTLTLVESLRIEFEVGM